MIYVGTKLLAPTGYTDPCLIDPSKGVARSGSYTERQTGYWASYSEISSSARRAYLNWLAQGRSDPACDIGYVFLFFYGLERRVIVDAPKDPAARQDIPLIAAELRRLLGIYGATSGSFQRYASELLNWVELEAPAEKLYLRPLPDLHRSYELPMYMRYALGQAAVDRAPIPAQTALAWARLEPQISLRTPATRCAEEFGQLFLNRYNEILGAGMVLPKNRTRLKFTYRPASCGIRGVEKRFGDIPDITVLTAPIKTLQGVVDQCSNELASYSRLVGKDPDARQKLDGLLQLPVRLWPEGIKARLQDLAAKAKNEPILMQLSELPALLGSTHSSFNKEKLRGLAQTLASAMVGMEPDILAGAKTPTDNDPIVLFPLHQPEIHDSRASAYQAAALTLQLASAVAQADGNFTSQEEEHLIAEIDQWRHLTDPHRMRLKAHLRLLKAAPVTLTSLKKRLEPLEIGAREAIAAFMATLAQADGIVSPTEVKFLEKVYRALGVDPQRVFSDIHAASASGGTPTNAEKTGFRLDATRIAKLQKDTEKVTALLAGIFKEEEEEPAPTPAEEIEAMPASGLLGLDEPHSALVRLLLSRPQWARSELEDAAADLELMLDGALEQINEASFDAFDMPFTEGEDPVEIANELVERIET